MQFNGNDEKLAMIYGALSFNYKIIEAYRRIKLEWLEQYIIINIIV